MKINTDNISDFVLGRFSNGELKAHDFQLDDYDCMVNDDDDPCIVCISNDPKSKPQLPQSYLCLSCEYDKMPRLERKILKYKKDNNLS